MQLFFNILGTIGVFLILLAFFLLQRKKLTDDDLFYNILNIIGGAFVGIYASYFKAWISVGLNFIWVIIAIFDIIANMKRGRR